MKGTEDELLTARNPVASNFRHTEDDLLSARPGQRSGTGRGPLSLNLLNSAGRKSFVDLLLIQSQDEADAEETGVTPRVYLRGASPESTAEQGAEFRYFVDAEGGTDLELRQQQGRRLSARRASDTIRRATIFTKAFNEDLEKYQPKTLSKLTAPLGRAAQAGIVFLVALSGTLSAVLCGVAKHNAAPDGDSRIFEQTFLEAELLAMVALFAFCASLFLSFVVGGRRPAMSEMFNCELHTMLKDYSLLSEGLNEGLQRQEHFLGLNSLTSYRSLILLGFFMCFAKVASQAPAALLNQKLTRSNRLGPIAQFCQWSFLSFFIFAFIAVMQAMSSGSEWRVLAFRRPDQLDEVWPFKVWLLFGWLCVKSVLAPLCFQRLDSFWKAFADALCVPLTAACWLPFFRPSVSASGSFRKELELWISGLMFLFICAYLVSRIEHPEASGGSGSGRRDSSEVQEVISPSVKGSFVHSASSSKSRDSRGKEPVGIDASGAASSDSEGIESDGEERGNAYPSASPSGGRQVSFNRNPTSSTSNPLGSSVPPQTDPGDLKRGEGEEKGQRGPASVVGTMGQKGKSAMANSGKFSLDLSKVQNR
uniref:Transmembrane protein n=1 Tax=Chromera velia CCMP2878 TaxID=1169474 RepID=A0A0G4HM12_9ALVE|eukprot:Cvel_29127.t1-p1 / transcript=Cvel_29127.t1 / gene=Cvel_29127 / organism=Chromera_velia_CCMP2878 / gene_product=hypothetical protein / transcript_product=hypothetical protein / location=Cvel_scaffold3935:5453-11870(-) / protein_length=591 / sequence_SO=supercontig / SO=protein_coding / is_pseudo=false